MRSGGGAMNALAVAAGGCLGALARYGVAVAVARFWPGAVPLATFAVNVSGCLALGYVATWGSAHAALPGAWRPFLVTGFLGAYTTFSAFEGEAVDLADRGATALAIAYVAASLACGFAAVRVGAALAR